MRPPSEGSRSRTRTSSRSPIRGRRRWCSTARTWASPRSGSTPSIAPIRILSCSPSISPAPSPGFRDDRRLRHRQIRCDIARTNDERRLQPLPRRLGRWTDDQRPRRGRAGGALGRADRLSTTGTASLPGATVRDDISSRSRRLRSGTSRWGASRCASTGATWGSGTQRRTPTPWPWRRRASCTLDPRSVRGPRRQRERRGRLRVLADGVRSADDGRVVRVITRLRRLRVRTHHEQPLRSGRPLGVRGDGQLHATGPPSSKTTPDTDTNSHEYAPSPRWSRNTPKSVVFPTS